MTAPDRPVSVLLVEDDEGDLLLTRGAYEDGDGALAHLHAAVGTA